MKFETTPLFLTANIQDLTVPSPPEGVESILPTEQTGLGDALLSMLQSALEAISPDITQAIAVCITLCAAMLIVSMLQTLHTKIKALAALVTALTISAILFSGTNALISQAAQTVSRLSDYGKLLIPVMTTALAAQGGISSSATIYTTTAVFDALLTALISKLLIPMVYIFLALSIANSAIGEDILKKLRDFMKWLISWSLKTILYIFTGYVTITGVVSGVTDMTAMKATKLTISGMVPVVGGILSDASEAVLVGAGAIKSTVGVGGMIVIFAIVIGPFLRIGVHYLLLKFTSAITAVFSDAKSSELIQDFSTAMGFLLAMTGTVCVMFLISVVCMMRGMNG